MVSPYLLAGSTGRDRRCISEISRGATADMAATAEFFYQVQPFVRIVPKTKL